MVGHIPKKYNTDIQRKTNASQTDRQTDNQPAKPTKRTSNKILEDPWFTTNEGKYIHTYLIKRKIKQAYTHICNQSETTKYRPKKMLINIDAYTSALFQKHKHTLHLHTCTTASYKHS